jgi:hypothetical protein
MPRAGSKGPQLYIGPTGFLPVCPSVCHYWANQGPGLGNGPGRRPTYHRLKGSSGQADNNEGDSWTTVC